MARKPTVRYFPSRAAYYCQYAGKQHPLASGPDDSPTGPTYLSALAAFTRLMSRAAAPEQGDSNTLRTVFELYIAHVKGRVAPATLKHLWYSLDPWIVAHGAIRVSQITHFRVYEYLTTLDWADSTKAVFLADASSAMNWAVKSGLISRNPLAGIERPSIRTRSRDCLVDDNLHTAVLAALRSEPLREFIRALQNTGARPSELRHATAGDFDAGLGAVVYHGDDTRREDEFRHKTAGSGKSRIIRFTGAVLDRLVARITGKPRGTPCFPSRRGTAYSRTGIEGRFEWARRRLEITGLTAYSYRHTFATNWLLAGGSVDVLGELLGNSPATIRRHYSHIASSGVEVRRQLEVFTAR